MSRSNNKNNENNNNNSNEYNINEKPYSVDSDRFTYHFTFFDMVVLMTGSLSVLQWEEHMEASNFSLLETQSESQGAPLKIRRIDVFA